MRYAWTALVVGLAAGIALGATVPALAHHSPAAFDRTKEVTLTGTVKVFRWQNPHTFIDLEVTDEQGRAVVWGVELTSPTYLIRSGWTSKIIKPGDTVTVKVNPVRTGEPAGIFISLTLPDGRVLTEQPAALGTSSN